MDTWGLVNIWSHILGRWTRLLPEEGDQDDERGLETILCEEV